MITVQQFFTNPTTGEEKQHTMAQEVAVAELLDDVNSLQEECALAIGKDLPIDPDTHTEISGTRNGTGGGGFRELEEGPSKYSSHKVLFVQMPSGTWVVDTLAAKAAVDRYDPSNDFDTWLDQFELPDGDNSKLREYNLFREHPDDTPGWCHLTKRPPRSGHRTFKP
jgi:hypothetical protein